MNMTYANTNTGALFRNGNRRSDNDPLYCGAIDINGAKFYLSAWVRSSKAGQKYMALSVKPKPEDVPERKAAMAGAGSRDDMADENPF
jgi:hypothetical protein